MEDEEVELASWTAARRAVAGRRRALGPAVEENSGGYSGRARVAVDARGDDIDGEAAAATRATCASLRAPRRRAATQAPHELEPPKV